MEIERDVWYGLDIPEKFPESALNGRVELLYRGGGRWLVARPARKDSRGHRMPPQKRELPDGENRGKEYAQISLGRPGDGRSTVGFQFSKVLLLNFVGPPEGARKYANHADGDVNNMDIANLRWGEHHFHSAKKAAAGKPPGPGEANPEEKVRRARELYAKGANEKDIARMAGLSRTAVRNITKFISHKHVTTEWDAACEARAMAGRKKSKEA